MEFGSKVVIMMSCVAETQQHVEFLKQSIQSIKDQHTKPFGFCLSIYSNPEVDFPQRDVQVLCKGVASEVKILWQKEKKYQFQGFQRLQSRLGTWFPSAGWVMLAGERDIWSPDRFTYFSKCIEEAQPDTTAILCHQLSSHNHLCQCTISSWRDVDRAIAQCNCIVFDHTQTVLKGESRYYQYANRVDKFSAFFMSENQYHINHNRFCSTFFVEKCLQENVEGMFLISAPAPWLYFRRDWKDTSDVPNAETPFPSNWSDDELVAYVQWFSECVECPGSRRYCIALFACLCTLMTVFSPELFPRVQAETKRVFATRKKLADSYCNEWTVPEALSNLSEESLASLTEREDIKRRIDDIINSQNPLLAYFVSRAPYKTN